MHTEHCHYRYLCLDSSIRWYSQLPSHIRLNERYYLIINKIESVCRMLAKHLRARPHWVSFAVISTLITPWIESCCFFAFSKWKPFERVALKLNWKFQCLSKHPGNRANDEKVARIRTCIGPKRWFKYITSRALTHTIVLRFLHGWARRIKFHNRQEVCMSSWKLLKCQTPAARPHSIQMHDGNYICHSKRIFATVGFKKSHLRAMLTWKWCNHLIQWVNWIRISFALSFDSIEFNWNSQFSGKVCRTVASKIAWILV